MPGPGPLDNDVNPDGGQPLAMIIDTNASLGTVKLTTGGGFDYVQAPGTTCVPGLSDSFTYFAFDGTDPSADPATVTIDIQCLAAVPVPVNNRWALAAAVLLILLIVTFSARPRRLRAPNRQP